MSLLDFIFKRKKKISVSEEKKESVDTNEETVSSGSSKMKLKLKSDWKELDISEERQVDKVLEEIRKNSHTRTKEDLAILSAINEELFSMRVNQEVIKDAVLVKDDEFGEIGLADYIKSDNFMKKFGKIKDIAIKLPESTEKNELVETFNELDLEIENTFLRDVLLKKLAELNGKKITSPQLARVLNKNRTSIARELNSLRTQGFVKSHGQKPIYYWKE